MPKVSVIVPVYGVEQYIARCARSLFAQTLEDMEFIFVDDCSPDRSVDVLEGVLSEFPARAGQVRLIRLPVNSGLPYVRKTGFEASAGDFILHCDSDDWLEEDACARLWEKAVSEDADVVVCDYYTESAGGTEKRDAGGDSAGDPVSRLLSGRIPGYVWNKLVRRGLYGRLECWPAANMWEDKVLSVQFLYFSRNTVFLPGALYHYRISDAGMCLSEQTRRKVSQLQDNVALILSFLESKGLAERYGRELSALKAEVQMFAMSLPRKEYLAVYPENRFRQFLSPFVPFSWKAGHLTRLLGVHGLSSVFRR